MIYLNTAQKKILKWVIFLFPIAFIFFCAFTKWVTHRFISFNLYKWFVREDGPVECCTSIIYFISFIFALLIAIRFFKEKHNLHSLLYLILSIGFLFVCLEEISWGQRIFKVETPGFFLKHNYQDEITLHNIDLGFHYLHQSYMIIGFYGAFSFLILPKKIKTFNNLSVNFFSPNALLIFYFLPVFIFYFYWDYISQIELYLFGDYLIRGWHIDWRQQEPAEFLLSLGFLFFVVTNKYRQNLLKKLQSSIVTDIQDLDMLRQI